MSYSVILARCVVARYIIDCMMKTISDEDYRALSEFRYEIRKFLMVSEKIARSHRLQPQQYMVLLTLRGLRPNQEPTIIFLAERLQIRHHSAVGLINRLAKRRFIRRCRSKADSRKTLIRLTSAGNALIEEVVRMRFVELASSQPMLLTALGRIVRIAKSSDG